MEHIEAHNKVVDTQLAQHSIELTRLSKQFGKLPSQPDHNQRENCNAIFVESDFGMGKGTMIYLSDEELKELENPEYEEIKEITSKDEEKPKESEKAKEDVKSPSSHEIQTPCQQRLEKANKEEREFKKFAKLIHQLMLTLPFTDLIKIAPLYEKFMKKILFSKRPIEGEDLLAVEHECNVLVSEMTPTKVQDPGRFSVPCMIGDTFFEGPLADLGASVSVMSLVTYKDLGLKGLKPVKVILHMADGSAIKPNGIVEDIPVKVGKFVIPCDFLVMNTKSDMNTPLILGRPFLATAKAKIEVASGKLTFEVGGETIEVESLAKKNASLKKEVQALLKEGESTIGEVVAEGKPRRRRRSRAQRRARKKMMESMVNGSSSLSSEPIQKKFSEITIGLPSSGNGSLLEAPS